MTVTTYGGRSVAQLRRRTAELYGLTCHLCGRPIARLAELEPDHLIPRNVRPDLAFDLTNVRPAHGTQSVERCNQRRGSDPDLDAVRRRLGNPLARRVDGSGFFSSAPRLEAPRPLSFPPGAPEKRPDPAGPDETRRGAP